MDNSIYSNLVAYASFGGEQQRKLRSISRDFQLWHRKIELPAYVDLLEKISLLVESARLLTSSEIAEIIQVLEGFPSPGFVGNPLAGLSGFLSGITDTQSKKLQIILAGETMNS